MNYCQTLKTHIVECRCGEQCNNECCSDDENELECVQRKFSLSLVRLVILDFLQNVKSRENFKHKTKKLNKLVIFCLHALKNKRALLSFLQDFAKIIHFSLSIYLILSVFPIESIGFINRYRNFSHILLKKQKKGRSYTYLHYICTFQVRK